MSVCTPHREFLAALADGETGLVPADTLAHVETCPDCAREIRAHRLLTSRLRQAIPRLDDPAPTKRVSAWTTSRLRYIAGAVAATFIVAGAGVALFYVSHPDPVQAAVNASSQPVQFQSSDPSEVGQWCLRASGRTLPVIELDGMQIAGARMDRLATTDIVTVVYIAPSGARVSVSWLEGQRPPGSGVEDRNLAGRELLIVHSAAGTAVVTASSADAMWQTAAAIEAAPS